MEALVVVVVMMTLFVFLGSVFSSIYNLYQSYLLDFVIRFIISIMVFVVCMVVFLLMGKGCVKNFGFNKKLWEFWCRVVPILILVVQVVCSYGLLYYDGLITNNSSEVGFLSGAKLDVKVIGRQ